MSEDQKVLGKFIWHDLMTSDVDKAVAFYTDLFGWTVHEVDMAREIGKYKMIRAAGKEQGGFVPLPPEDSHLPSRWICYGTVEDVDAAAAKAVELGGQAPETGMDVPGVGRFAVIVDPQGAAVSPYRPERWPEEGNPGSGQPGTFVWHELLASDPEEEGRFFSEIFGWTTEEMDMGPMGTYYLFKRPDKPEIYAGGMLRHPSGPSSWLLYIGVEDADATAARIEPLGGKLWVKPKDIPGVGRMAVAGDPMEALFAILQPVAG
jgi:predicted enzyme related to lactoylglutathione lyase